MSEIVRIFALGGLDEDGKNLYVCQINDDIYVLDAGIKFPTRNTPGIDYIRPDCSYLTEHKDHIKGYFISHGHDDQLGTLCFIYKKAKAPVYCSKVTAMFIKLFCEHSDLDFSSLDIHIVEPSSEFMVEGRRITFFQLPHNMAQSSGIAIKTDLGNVIYTSDFIIDYNTPKDYSLDLNTLSKLGEENTLALLTPSSYANRNGYTSPGHRLITHLRSVFENKEGRIFISLFSTNFYNIQEAINYAINNGRKICVFDEETEKTINNMQNLGLINIDPNFFVPASDIARHRDEELCIFICGFSLKLLNKINILGEFDYIGDTDDLIKEIYMLHPSYTDLMKVVNSEVEPGEAPVVNSRYSIVMATSKRARQIIGGEETLVAMKESKPLSAAIQELNEGKIKIMPED